MKSVFMDKGSMPTDEDLKRALGKLFDVWVELVDYTEKVYSGAAEEWKYGGEKYGWSFRISDKKRVLIYLLPRAKFFKVAFVFGQKATDAILKSNISESIVNELKAAKVYAEGRGIRIDVKDGGCVEDLKKLVDIKVGN
jgi:hypothetical protein